MVEIGHAIMDENGQIDGPLEGDNTGKEVARGEWYAENKKGIGWLWYIEAKSDALRERHASFIEQICDNDAVGYSQKRRWTAHKYMLANDRNPATARGSVDCTSVIIMAAIFAGVDIKPEGYSANLARILRETGQYRLYDDADHLKVDYYAKRGGIYVRNGHGLTVLSNGVFKAETYEPPKYSHVLIIGTGKTVNVRKLPGVPAGDATAAEKRAHGVIYTACSGDTLPFISIDKSGWYYVETPAGRGYISCNIPQHVKLVTA